MYLSDWKAKILELTYRRIDLPHDDLVNNLNKMVEFACSGGNYKKDGSGKYLTVKGTAVSWTKNKDSRNSRQMQLFRLSYYPHNKGRKPLQCNNCVVYNLIVYSNGKRFVTSNSSLNFINNSKISLNK